MPAMAARIAVLAYSTTANPYPASSSSEVIGVSAPSTMLATCAPGTRRGISRSSSRDRGASTNAMSAPSAR